MKGQDSGWSGNMPYVPPLDASGKVWRLSDLQFYLALQAGSHMMNMRLSDIEMPPFAERLSAADIASLFDHVKASWSKQQLDYQAEVTRQQEGPRPNRMAVGHDLYMARCAICHGAEMEGQSQRVGEGNRARTVVIPALKGNGLARGTSDGDLRQLILGGEAYHPAPHSEYRMPNANLSDDDVRALIAYLRRAW
jgi:mono/diheme cytochrome c family protein